MTLLGLDKIADDHVEITLEDGGKVPSKKKVPVHLPKCTTIRNLFETCLDIRAIIKKVIIAFYMILYSLEIFILCQN